MKALFPIVLLTVFFFSLPSMAQEEQAIEPENKADWSIASQWGVGAKAGLNGLGFEIVKGFGDRLNLRVGYSGLTIPYSLEQTFEGFDLLAKANVKLGGASLLIDFYPVKNIIHLTAGVLQNNTLKTVGVSPQSGFPYGDLTIPAEDVGRIDANISLGMPYSPYFGLGFGNTLSREKVVSFNFELGALYHGGPAIDLSGDGIIGPMASEHNETVLSDAVAQYTWFPSLSLQLTFKII